MRNSRGVWAMAGLFACTEAHSTAASLLNGEGGALPTPELLRVVTYNVAGLPELLSPGQPSRTNALIGPRLNDYDLALLQEDFAYHALIVAAVRHPHQSPPDLRDAGIGDGLSLLSTLPFSGFTRIPWASCHGTVDSGSDCLTPKGFSFARLSVGALEIDVYDVHADAGSAPGDQAARADNLRQLAAEIAARSAGRAVIVAGDFNARYTHPGDELPTLLDGAALQDAWVVLARAGSRPVPGAAVRCSPVDPDDPACERIDKILYRSGGGVRIEPRSYRVEGARFVDAAGAQLSDHRPVSVELGVRAAN